MICISDPNTTVEYVPEVIFIHNKLELSEMGPQNYEALRNIYCQALDEETLHFRYDFQITP